jgi:hypothetical protein
MNARERVAATFRHEETDLVPVMHIGFSSAVASALIGREAFVGGGIQQWREAVAWWRGEEAHQEFVSRSLHDAIDVALVCGHDIVRVRYWRYDKKPTKRINEHTFLYEYGPEENWTVLQYDPGSEQCHIHSYIPPTSLTFQDLELQLDELEEDLAAYRPSREDFAAEFQARELLENQHVIRMSCGHCGIPSDAIWMEATILRPDLVERLLDLQVKRTELNIRFLATHGFHYIFGGSDFSGNDGPMYSPATFRKLYLPRLKRIAEICHECESVFSFDSDGNLWPVADDLFGNSGIDAYHEIDRRAGMDLRELRQRFPKLVLIGNISSYDVATGSKDQVIAQTLDCVAVAKETTGVIVGCSNYFVPGTPIENVIAIVKTLLEYR